MKLIQRRGSTAAATCWKNHASLQATCSGSVKHALDLVEKWLEFGFVEGSHGSSWDGEGGTKYRSFWDVAGGLEKFERWPGADPFVNEGPDLSAPNFVWTTQILIWFW